MKLISKIVSLSLSIIIFYTASITAYASEIVKDEITSPFSISEIQKNLKEITIDNNKKIIDSNIQKSIIENSVSISNIQSQENNSPIAGLQMVVLNPESLINGKLTTETQMAWLWSYNGENYTYDPDGDNIIDMKIGGTMDCQQFSRQLF